MFTVQQSCMSIMIPYTCQDSKRKIEKREEIASFLRGRCNFCVFWFVFWMERFLLAQKIGSAVLLLWRGTLTGAWVWVYTKEVKIALSECSGGRRAAL